MKLFINGEPRELEGPRNIAELITALDLAAPALLVEHNSLALRRDEWSTRSLTANDRIEIINIVAGG